MGQGKDGHWWYHKNQFVGYWMYSVTTVVSRGSKLLFIRWARFSLVAIDRVSLITESIIQLPIIRLTIIYILPVATDPISHLAAIISIELPQVYT